MKVQKVKQSSKSNYCSNNSTYDKNIDHKQTTGSLHVHTRKKDLLTDSKDQPESHHDVLYTRPVIPLTTGRVNSLQDKKDFLRQMNL